MEETISGMGTGSKLCLHGTIFGNSGVSWAFENTNQDKTANVEKREQLVG